MLTLPHDPPSLTEPFGIPRENTVIIIIRCFSRSNIFFLGASVLHFLYEMSEVNTYELILNTAEFRDAKWL